ncbi:MAG TPA: glycosyltransferase family 1 protein [Gammaproteobacteria bacterium]|nr:glycosyltransferase family 1 protein [Gammaproteobacteria bacterium]
MKILLSAYACEPNAGSDKEVGWQWAIRLANLGHDVWVLVRSVHKAAIEKECDVNGKPENLHFVYYEIDWFIRNTNWFKGRIYFYYYLWQWVAATRAKQLHKEKKFDVVHHVTWVSLRQPSFMGRLGIPFIYGPCAGGETAPFCLRVGYSLRQWVSDVVRDIANALVRFDPFMQYVFRSAESVYVTSEQSRRLISGRFHRKVKIHLAIGMDLVDIESLEKESDSRDLSNNDFRVLHVGRFVGWKGMHLGLAAFAKLKNAVPSARLTMVGKGGDEKTLRKIAIKLGINDAIDWVSWVDQKDLLAIYMKHDCFLFPSLHDSGGLVVLEAMRSGLPVVCLDLGGPGVIVNESCGFSVETRNCSRDDVINKLSDSMTSLANNSELRKTLSSGAINRVNEFTWEHLIKRIYEEN